MEKVQITEDCFRSLLTHALLTDAEEVLGVLFGELFEKHITIYASQTLVQNCKEKDRVEVDPVQQSYSVSEAETISQ